MPLLSGQGSQTLTSLKKDSMYFYISVFYISELFKSTRPGFYQHALEFVAYPTDKYLYACCQTDQFVFRQKHLH